MSLLHSGYLEAMSLKDALASSRCKNGSKHEFSAALIHSWMLASSLPIPPLVLALAPEHRRRASSADVDDDAAPAASNTALPCSATVVVRSTSHSSNLQLDTALTCSHCKHTFPDAQVKSPSEPGKQPNATLLQMQLQTARHTSLGQF